MARKVANVILDNYKLPYIKEEFKKLRIIIIKEAPFTHPDAKGKNYTQINFNMHQHQEGKIRKALVNGEAAARLAHPEELIKEQQEDKKLIN